MKIKISTIIDVPESALVKDAEFPSAIEFIFDMLTQYAEVKHLQEAMDYLVKAHRDATSPEYSIFKYHNSCADICRNLDWKYEQQEDNNELPTL